jgi:hypothetical protein
MEISIHADVPQRQTGTVCVVWRVVLSSGFEVGERLRRLHGYIAAPLAGGEPDGSTGGTARPRSVEPDVMRCRVN